jgi:hypothetical protein
LELQTAEHFQRSRISFLLIKFVKVSELPRSAFSVDHREKHPSASGFVANGFYFPCSFHSNPLPLSTAGDADGTTLAKSAESKSSLRNLQIRRLVPDKA